MSGINKKYNKSNVENYVDKYFELFKSYFYKYDGTINEFIKSDSYENFENNFELMMKDEGDDLKGDVYEELLNSSWYIKFFELVNERFNFNIEKEKERLFSEVKDLKISIIPEFRNKKEKEYLLLEKKEKEKAELFNEEFNKLLDFKFYKKSLQYNWYKIFKSSDSSYKFRIQNHHNYLIDFLLTKENDVLDEDKGDFYDFLFMISDEFVVEYSQKSLQSFKNIIKKLEREKSELQQNIMQAVSHTLGNMIFVQKSITKHLLSSNNIDEDIKRLQLFQTLTSSILDSIKVAFGGNIDNNIEFFNYYADNKISLSSIFYFTLSINLENLLLGAQEWKKKRKKLFNINSNNRKEIFTQLRKLKENNVFGITNLLKEDIDMFKKYFESDQFEFVKKYFNIDVESFENIFTEKDSYTFAIIFVIFQELTKNMFKYGSTENQGEVIFNIISKKNSVIFENIFVKEKNNNKIGTLKGLKMIKMFANVLGNFENNTKDNLFSIKIQINGNNIKGR